MKIVVLNGSPKGEQSVTLQYVHFIENQFPQHQFTILPVAQQIHKIDREPDFFREWIGKVRESDGVIWAFPLYVFLVSSQYKRFIELVWEREAQEAFRNKYAAVLTTSIHFFDHTAHNYLRAICDDLDMKFVGGFSADMYDLLKKEEREKLKIFGENLFLAIEGKKPGFKNYLPLKAPEFEYVPGEAKTQINPAPRKITLVTDSDDVHTNLGKMIARFKNAFAGPIETIHLQSLDMKGGCLGCIRCGQDNRCTYEGKDAFIETYKTKIQTADILVFAGTLRDRYLSSRWKMFFDRAFFNTHTPSLSGKQIGFILSGPLAQNPNLREILEAYTEWQKANLVDMATDEAADSEQIDSRLQALAEQLLFAAEKNYLKPPTFLGVGGMKIFRDDIWGRLRFPFQADHAYYKKHGVYDFPQKDFKARVRNRILILLTKIPAMRKEIYTRRMKAEMVKPLQRIVAGTQTVSRKGDS